MDTEILKVVGQVAGLGGVALGVFLILFREFLRKQIFPTLTKDHSYRLLRLLLVLVWSVALSGIAAWIWVSVNSSMIEKNDITLSDPPPPKVGSFQAKTTGATFIFIKDKSGHLNKIPITLIIDVPRLESRHYDYSIIFDITNIAKTDLRIISFVFKTLTWSPLPEIEYYLPLPGLGEIKKYFGIINKEIQEYPCKFEQEGKFVILRSGELDTFQVAITAQTEGIYNGELILDYSVGGIVKKMVVGKVFNVYFVNQDKAFALKRYESKQ